MNVGRFKIKKRIELEVMRQCDVLKNELSSVTVEAQAVVLLKKIVRLLCTKWSSFLIFKRDLRRVDKILLAAGFNAGKASGDYDPDWCLNLTSWLYAQSGGGKLPYEIACGMTAKEAEKAAKEIGRKRIQDALRLFQIKHDPEGALEDINKEMARLTDTEQEEIAVIENRAPIMSQVMRNAYRA